MQKLGINGYTDQQVLEALITNREVYYEFNLLDKSEKRIGVVDDVSGSFSLLSTAEIKCTAKFTINEKRYKDIDFMNERIQPYFCLKTKNEWIKWPQGIYLLSSPNRSEKSGGIYREIDAYDKGLILKEDRVDNRYFIQKGTYYIDAIRMLILSSGIVKISIQDSELMLSVDKEYPIGTSKLDILNDLLNAINYNSIYFDENGFCMVRKYIIPKERLYEFEYKTDKKSIILPGSVETLDAFSIPNKFVRYVENPEANYLISSFINDKASNKLSTVSRGRTITDIQAVTDIADQATLDEYVKRIATERSQVFGGVKFETMAMPHHTYLDCFYVKNESLGISEKVIETAWSVNTTGDTRMTHTCKKVVELW